MTDGTRFLSRRLRIISLTALLLAAQAGVLTHAVAHALRADLGTCLVCHAADQFKHGVTGSQVVPAPEGAAPGFTPVLQPSVRTAVVRAFLARAPPSRSS